MCWTACKKKIVTDLRRAGGVGAGGVGAGGAGAREEQKQIRRSEILVGVVQDIGNRIELLKQNYKNTGSG